MMDKSKNPRHRVRWRHDPKWVGGVLDSSIVQGPFSVTPCQTLVSRFATFSSPYAAVSVLGQSTKAPCDLALVKDQQRLASGPGFKLFTQPSLRDRSIFATVWTHASHRFGSFVAVGDTTSLLMVWLHLSLPPHSALCTTSLLMVRLHLSLPPHSALCTTSLLMVRLHLSLCTHLRPAQPPAIVRERHRHAHCERRHREVPVHPPELSAKSRWEAQQGTASLPIHPYLGVLIR
jgi:hypothetical protein